MLQKIKLYSQQNSRQIMCLELGIVSGPKHHRHKPRVFQQYDIIPLDFFGFPIHWNTDSNTMSDQDAISSYNSLFYSQCPSNKSYIQWCKVWIKSVGNTLIHWTKIEFLWNSHVKLAKLVFNTHTHTHTHKRSHTHTHTHTHIYIYIYIQMFK